MITRLEEYLSLETAWLKCVKSRVSVVLLLLSITLLSRYIVQREIIELD